MDIITCALYITALIFSLLRIIPLLCKSLDISSLSNFETKWISKFAYAALKFCSFLSMVNHESPAWLISRINLPNNALSSFMGNPYWVS